MKKLSLISVVAALVPLYPLSVIAETDGMRHQVPAGAVIAFNRWKCPDGWKEYKPAYGRFIRGIDRTEPQNDKKDKEYNRKPGHTQGDTFKKHRHRVEKKLAIAKEQYHGPYLAGSDTSQISPDESLITEEGGFETRPKNVALLYCEKKGKK